MRFLYVIIGVVLSFALYGQKPPLTLQSYEKWSNAGEGALSPDGKYALYTINDFANQTKTLRVKHTNGVDYIAIKGASRGAFSADSKYVIATIHNDTLLCLELKSKRVNKISGYRSFILGRFARVECIIADKCKTGFSILDFSGKIIFSNNTHSQYYLGKDRDLLLFSEQDSSTKMFTASWIDPKANTIKRIYIGENIDGVVFDKSNTQAAFIEATKNGNRLVYYSSVRDSVAYIYDSQRLEVVQGDYWAFSSDGKRFFFSLQDDSNTRQNSLENDLEIWNYLDDYPQSYYNGKGILGDNIKTGCFLATVDLSTNQVLQLTKDDQVVTPGTLNTSADDYCVIETKANLRSSSWNDGHGRSYYLCETRSGNLIPLEMDQKKPLSFWPLSPKSRFTVYYRPTDQSYYSFEVATRTRRQVFQNSNGILTDYRRLHYFNLGDYPNGVAGWMSDEESVLINGSYDLWSVDPRGIRKPFNLTAGIGEKQKIVFSLADPGIAEKISERSKILVTGFNTKNMEYSFYTLNFHKKVIFDLLSTGKHYIADAGTPLYSNNLYKTPGGYLILKEQADKSPNYFFSPDLKKFTQISEVQPERSWNWMTTELHVYKDSLGNELRGTLYKPENFDPTKKYPIIFNIYEFRSNFLNKYFSPELRGGEFSIPVMVSNGYLVFMPDIKSEPTFGGKAALRSVIAAVDHLAQYQWIDTSRMGLAGHSVGGFEANYIVSHSNRFKAVLSGAGISDMIRAATDLWAGGLVKQEFLKSAVYMMKEGLPYDVDIYIRNSPILYAKNVNTPLLLFHNDDDGSVRFEQSRSFFLVLRDLRKPCWWLNYKGDGHVLTGGKKKLDYNTRVWQYFDYYLKNKPEPNWMIMHN